MKEVKSESSLIGKILTCEICQRSFVIEPGDEILKGFTTYSRKKTSFFSEKV